MRTGTWLSRLVGGQTPSITGDERSLCRADTVAGASPDWPIVLGRLHRRRFFHELPYFEAALASVLERDRSSVRVLHVPGRALLPIRVRTGTLDRLPGVRFLEIPHHPVLDLYDGLLVPGDLEAASAVLDALDDVAPGGWDVLWLPRVMAESSLLEGLRRLSPRGLVIREVGESKSISVSGGYEAVKARISHKFLVNERRKLKKLGQSGKVEHRIFFPVRRDDPSFLEFLRLEAAGWKGQIQSTIAGTPPVRAFFEELIERLGPAKACRIDHLCLDGTAIAGQLALISDGTLSLLKIGYDEQYQAVGPGGLLLHETLRGLGASEGIEELSFVTGAKWNDAWGATAQAVFDVRIYNDTALGRLGQHLTTAEPYLKRGLAWVRARRNAVSKVRSPAAPADAEQSES